MYLSGFCANDQTKSPYTLHDCNLWVRVPLPVFKLLQRIITESKTSLSLFPDEDVFTREIETWRGFIEKLPLLR